MTILEEISQKLEYISASAREEFENVNDRASLELQKSKFLGPNGSLTLITREMRNLSKEDRPVLGQKINESKNIVQQSILLAMQRVEAKEIAQQLGEPADSTLSAERNSFGMRHPLSIVRRRIEEIFKSMGYSLVDTSEVETEWFCFDALNMPKTHPARDAMDTFFLPDSLEMENVSKKEQERYLLRTHTTTSQIRTLLKEPLPLKVIAPGRVFRRDTVDATHSANFHQCDVVHVDKNISIIDLKDSIDFFLKALFGERVETRYRPSFFPFTMPSFEVDLRSPDLGKLSNTWIEILGCGLIHPNVLRAANIDPNEWSGHAWGIGIERVAMLLYGIDDIRNFYRNDIRFLKQFN